MLLLKVGKFGRGKSDITKSFVPYFPNSAIINTMSSSSAGLKSGIQRDEKGQFTLVLGTLPRCHNSFVGLEEIDKTEDKGNSYLQVISDGSVRIDKIIQFTRKIHVSFIVNANPKHGDFDAQSTYFSQIDLPMPFIDRSDVIVIPPPPFTVETRDDFAKRIFGQDIVKSPYQDSLIKTVMIYLKRYTKNPIILEDGIDEIKKLWVYLQRQGIEKEHREATFNFEIRALISIIKFTKAWGRLHDYNTMDAHRTAQALKILKEGAYDTYLTSTGIEGFYSQFEGKQRRKIPMTRVERKDFVIATISRYKNGLEQGLLAKICADMNFTTTGLNQIIDALKREGQILETVTSGKSIYRLGVVDGSISTEYIDRKSSCEEFILNKIGDGELSDTELSEYTEFSHDELLKTVDNLKSKGDIIEPTRGKLRKV